MYAMEAYASELGRWSDLTRAYHNWLDSATLSGTTYI